MITISLYKHKQHIDSMAIFHVIRN